MIHSIRLLCLIVIRWIPCVCFTFSSNPAGNRLFALFDQQPERALDRGFNFLAKSPVPQGAIVSAVSESWRFAWCRLMTELAPQDETGAYQRPSYVTASSNIQLHNDPGRYRLYTGNPCPWCHRVLLAYKYLQLEETISHTTLIDNPKKASRGGWILKERENGFSDLKQVYDYYQVGGGRRCTAPLLVDTKEKVFVSNESSDIVRMFNTLAKGNLLPQAREQDLNAMNEWIYSLLNNGVYRCGFATSQRAYDAASKDVLRGLQQCEATLNDTGTFLMGPNFTEADLRLLPTILRFDGAYAPLFRAGGTHLRIRSDYPAIHSWLQRCWTTIPAVRDSIDISDACASYYRQLFPLNPSGIVPTPVDAEALGLATD